MFATAELGFPPATYGVDGEDRSARQVARGAGNFVALHRTDVTTASAEAPTVLIAAGLGEVNTGLIGLRSRVDPLFELACGLVGALQLEPKSM
ncbi:hypothetical protein D3C80_1830590 [compost metagenome]